MGMVCDHILGEMGDPSDDGGQPFSDWVTRPSLGRLVTIFFMVGDYPKDGV